MSLIESLYRLNVSFANSEKRAQIYFAYRYNPPPNMRQAYLFCPKFYSDLPT